MDKLKYAVFENWDAGDLVELANCHLELCTFLHEHWGDLPPKLSEELWDIVYRHFEP